MAIKEGQTCIDNNTGTRRKQWRKKPCKRCGECIYSKGKPSYISGRSLICDGCL